MEEQQKLVASMQLAGDIREFCQHPGFKILQRFIESKVADSRNEWLSAPNAQAAEEIRIKAKPFAEIENYLKKLLIEGEVARRNLDNLQNLQD